MLWGIALRMCSVLIVLPMPVCWLNNCCRSVILGPCVVESSGEMDLMTSKLRYWHDHFSEDIISLGRMRSLYVYTSTI